MPKPFINVEFGGHASKAEVKTLGSKQYLLVSIATEGGKKKDADGEFWPSKWWDLMSDQTDLTINKGDFVKGSGMMSYDEKDGKRFYKVKFAKITEVEPKHQREQAQKPVASNVHGQEITDDDIPF